MTQDLRFAAPELSIVVPACDDAPRLGTALTTLATFLAARATSAEVIVVDDASRDDTGRIIDRHQQVFTSLRALRCDRRGGIGRSVRLGMMIATGHEQLYLPPERADDIVLYDHLRAAAEQSGTHPDVLVATPTAPAERERSRPGSLERIVVGRLRPPWALTVFSQPAADAVFRRCRIDGRGFDIEALAIARTLGFSVLGVPADQVSAGRAPTRALRTTIVDRARVHTRLRARGVRAPGSGQDADSGDRLRVR